MREDVHLSIPNETVCIGAEVVYRDVEMSVGKRVIGIY